MLRRCLEVHLCSPNVAEIPQRQKNNSVKLWNSPVVSTLTELHLQEMLTQKNQPRVSRSPQVFFLCFTASTAEVYITPMAHSDTHQSFLSCRMSRVELCEGQGAVTLFLLAVDTTYPVFYSPFSAKLPLKLKGHQDLGPIKSQRSISSQEWYTDPREGVIKAPNQSPPWTYNEWCLYSDHFLTCACKRCRSFILFCSFQLKWQNEVRIVLGMSPFH